MPEIPELSPTEFRDRWVQAEGEPGAILLDVREPAEIALASVAGTRNIRMQEVPARLDELERDKPIVVMCHSGGRSRRVAEFLVANGYEQVFNLRGGIDAWSREVDPRVPRY